MGMHIHIDAEMTAQVLTLASEERAKSLSLREWKHRLAGYGYTVRDTEHGQVFASLRHDTDICAVPNDLLH